jgi:hypothetical protein
MTPSTSSPRLPWQRGVSASQLPTTRHVEPAEGHDRAVSGCLPYGWRERPADSVAESWRTQMLLVRLGGTTVRIQARLDVDAYGGVAGDQGETTWPLVGDLLVASCVRGRAPYLVDELDASRDAMRSQSARFHVRAADGDLLDRGHRWTEPALVGLGLTTSGRLRPDWPERFLGMCRRIGIDTVVRVRDGRWEVLTLTDHDVRVLTSDPCSVTRDVDRRCALLPAPEAGEYCRMRGGPWIRRSIEASLAWQLHRAQVVGAVGCDTCDGVRYLSQGTIRERGGPIGLVDLPVPNRWLVAVGEPHPVSAEGDA